MPLPAAVTGALIAGGSSLLGSGVNALSQGSMNKKTRQWNEKMYQVQRRNSLADWAMQNEYNSPTQQMARLRKAGLNPNLAYGNLADGNASSVQQQDVKSWNPQPVQVDLEGAASSGISTWYDIKMKEAQIDNLTTQNTVLTNDAILKAVQAMATHAGTGKTIADTELSKLEYSLKSSLFETTMAQAKANLEKTQVDTRNAITETELKVVQTSSNVAEAVERILTMRKSRAKTDAEIRHINAQIEHVKSDTELKRISIRSGVIPGAGSVVNLVSSTLHALDNLKGGIYKGAPQLNPKYQSPKMPPSMNPIGHFFGK